MCTCVSKIWKSEYLKCWWCFTASNGSDLISAGCILPISQSSGTFRMSSVLIHQHTLFVHLLSHCCMTHFPPIVQSCHLQLGSAKPGFALEHNLCWCVNAASTQFLQELLCFRDRMSQHFYLLFVGVSHYSDNLRILTIWVTITLNIKWPTSLVWTVAQWLVHMLTIHNSCFARRDAGLGLTCVMSHSHFFLPALQSQ